MTIYADAAMNVINTTGTNQPPTNAATQPNDAPNGAIPGGTTTIIAANITVSGNYLACISNPA